MKTKENSKRVLLTDEELMGVVGGLVQLVNPSSGILYSKNNYDCESAGSKDECKQISESKCKWRINKCKKKDT